MGKKKKAAKTKWRRHMVINTLFIGGLILTLLEISIYRKTIIELWIPLSIWLTPGLILTLPLYKKINKIVGERSNWFMHYVLHTAMTGGFLLFSFMATNYYFADKQIVKYEFEIKSKGSMSGPKGHRDEREPLVTIDYFGFEKELVFKYKDTSKVDLAKKVTLNVQKGFLGYDILNSYDTIDLGW